MNKWEGPLQAEGRVNVEKRRGMPRKFKEKQGHLCSGNRVGQKDSKYEARRGRENSF